MNFSRNFLWVNSILLFVMCFLCFAACSGKNEEDSYDYLEETRSFINPYPTQTNPYLYVGNLHNDGLDYVLEQFFTQRNTSLENTTITDYVDSLSLDFCNMIIQKNEYDLLYTTRYDSIFHTNFHPQILHDFTLTQDTIQLSVIGERTLNSIIDILKRSNSLSENKNRLKLLEQQVLTNTIQLSSFDQNILLGVLAVAISSNDYWQDFTQANIQSSVDGRELVLNDALGAIAGVARNRTIIRLCWAIGGPSSGAGAIGISILVGGIKASAQSGAISFIANLF